MEKFFSKSRNQSQKDKQKKVLQKKQILKAFYSHGTMLNCKLAGTIKLSTPETKVELKDEGLIYILGVAATRGGRRANFPQLAQNFYAGKLVYFGEFGQFPGVDKEAHCSCGKYGHLDTIASASAILPMKVKGSTYCSFALKKEVVYRELQNTFIKVIIKAASRCNKFVIFVVSKAACWLVKGIVFLIRIFNPGPIENGGMVSEANDFKSAFIHRGMNTLINRDISNEKTLKFSDLGRSADTVVAAA